MPNTHMKTREITVLVVDDDDIDYMGIKRAMASLKLLNPLVRACDGIEALKILRQKDAVQRPYLIILDLNMPRMGGLEMLRELRQDPMLSSAVVFVLTTSSADEDKFAAYKEHVAGYIVKSDMEAGFNNIIKMLDNYWRVVELPVDN